MYERLSKCPLCEGESFKNKIICNDYLVSNESFVIVRCENCALEFTNPRPKPEFISNFYKSESYISHSNKITDLTSILYRIARFFALKKKLKLINKLSTKGHILDYGCGTGAFLNICKKGGWKTSGVEPDQNAQTIARQISNIPITSNLKTLEDETTFDIITLWHVLEHISDLNQTIRELKQRIAKNGKLIVAVPNHEAYDQQIYKEHWAAYDLPRHLYHFDQKTMRTLMKNHHLKLVKTLPMKLDAYYVSLLSEQHLKKDGKQKSHPYYKSIINGYKSNACAKNNNNYSSLIYVFEK